MNAMHGIRVLSVVLSVLSSVVSFSCKFPNILKNIGMPLSCPLRSEWRVGSRLLIFVTLQLLSFDFATKELWLGMVGGWICFVAESDAGFIFSFLFFSSEKRLIHEELPVIFYSLYLPWLFRI